MNEHTRKSEAREIVDAEKGDSLTPRNLHLRLRVVETILVISLFLNLLHWYVAGTNDKRLERQVDQISQETGAQK